MFLITQNTLFLNHYNDNKYDKSTGQYKTKWKREGVWKEMEQGSLLVTNHYVLCSLRRKAASFGEIRLTWLLERLFKKYNRVLGILHSRKEVSMTSTEDSRQDEMMSIMIGAPLGNTLVKIWQILNL